jgi:outer membrane protein TolC
MIAGVLLCAALALPARPMTLAEATEIAVGVDGAVARARVEGERARLVVLRANLERVRATLDANLAGLYGKNVLAQDLGAALPLANLEANVSAPIFSGYRITAGIARAEHLQQAADLDIEVVRRQVALSVAQVYWSERRLALLEQARAASAERLAESERIVRARVDAGLSAGLDVNRAAARRVRLAVEHATLESQRREARARLRGLLGIDEEIELVDAPPAADELVEPVDGLVQRALDERPELRATERRRLALMEERRAVESAFWPQVGTSILVQAGNNPSIAGAGNRAVGGLGVSLIAGLGVSMNLFDTWTTTNAAEDVGHRQRQVQADLRQQLREVETGVRLAHARAAGLVEQRAALVGARDIVADNVTILERAYERGEVPLTELLDAQVELADAERQIVDVDAQLALARVELEVAVGHGGLWTKGAAPAPMASPAAASAGAER